MLNTILPKGLSQRVSTWFMDNVWSEDALVQGVVVLMSVALGWLTYHMLTKRATQALENVKMPIRVKRGLANIVRLIQPSATLVFLYLFSLIESSPIVGIDTSLTTGFMKALLAWIVIRIAMEFVGNQIVRSVFGLSIWIVAALSIFGVLDETTAMLDSIGFNLGNFRLSALAVIRSAFSIFFLLYLAMFLSTFAERRVLSTKSLTRSSQVLIVKVIRIGLIVCALMVAVTSAGIDLSVFAVFSGAVGLGVGFGLQKVVSNLFSGMLLLMDKSIQPGDVIEMNDNSGTFGSVNHMGARFTEIITRDNKSFLIPNEDFITQRVVNWSHGSRLIRLDINFGTHYKSNPHKVIAVAIEAAKKASRVVETPAPVCWLIGFGDSSINFSLRFWIKDPEAGVMNVKGDVFLSLWDAFKESGIEIPYPHREIFMHDAGA